MFQNIIELLQKYTFLNDWLSPLITVFIGIVVGWIIKKLFHSRIKKLTKKTQWKYDDIIIETIEKRLIFWFTLLAVYIAAGDLNQFKPYNLYILKITLALLMLSITLAASNMAIALLDEWSKSKGSKFPSTAIFSNLASMIIIAIGMMIILHSFGISIAPILTALGVGGLAVSLALKDTLSDFFAGLHILLSQKVRIGDFIELDSGEKGNVTNITWRNTTLVERENNVINIPNTRLSQAVIKNYDLHDTSYYIKIPVGVAYDSDLDHVEKITTEVANSVIADFEEASKEFPPMFRYHAFADSSINFTLYLRAAKYGDHHPLIHEFIKRLHKRFAQEGIEIPFPIRTLIQKKSE